MLGVKFQQLRYRNLVYHTYSAQWYEYLDQLSFLSATGNPKAFLLGLIIGRRES